MIKSWGIIDGWHWRYLFAALMLVTVQFLASMHTPHDEVTDVSSEATCVLCVELGHQSTGAPSEAIALSVQFIGAISVMPWPCLGWAHDILSKGPRQRAPPKA
jgi:hypothetical protein